MLSSIYVRKASHVWKQIYISSCVCVCACVRANILHKRKCRYNTYNYKDDEILKIDVVFLKIFINIQKKVVEEQWN